jgi:hypothetical protein
MHLPAYADAEAELAAVRERVRKLPVDERTASDLTQLARLKLEEGGQAAARMAKSTAAVLASRRDRRAGT